MTVLRLFLIAFFLVIVVYTGITLSREGLSLFAVYFGDLFALGWRGQFNLDFAGYLMLSALWLMWRSGFAMAGMVQALCAGVLGMMVFAPLVLVLSLRSGGDLRKLLLGVHA